MTKAHQEARKALNEAACPTSTTATEGLRCAARRTENEITITITVVSGLNLNSAQEGQRRPKEEVVGEVPKTPKPRLCETNFLVFHAQIAIH